MPQCLVRYRRPPTRDNESSDCLAWFSSALVPATSATSCSSPVSAYQSVSTKGTITAPPYTRADPASERPGSRQKPPTSPTIDHDQSAEFTSDNCDETVARYPFVNTLLSTGLLAVSVIQETERAVAGIHPPCSAAFHLADSTRSPTSSLESPSTRTLT